MDLNRKISRWFTVGCIAAVFVANVVFASGGLGGHWHLDFITPEHQQIEHEVERNRGRDASDRVMRYHDLPPEQQQNIPPPSKQDYKDAYKFFEDNLSYLDEIMFYLNINSA